MNPKATKTILEPNFVIFMTEVCAAAADGWELDQNNAPIQYGVMYEANFLKDASQVAPAKPTRSDILTTARAAKKAKAQEAPSDDVGQLSDDVLVQTPPESSETPVEAPEA